jgi:tRNA(Ile)-lysidine synthase
MKDTQFIDKLRVAIQRFGLINKGDRILIALSGGPDSMALLYGLLAIRGEYDLKLFVAHLNHKLRGRESDQDERFAKSLASKLKLKFFSKKIDVKREAQKRKMSIEETAREIRYRYLESLAEKIKADKIALGHQADDQAETFLMRLLRGAGAAGLSGIPPKRGKIIRPLIQIKREEIESFLKSNKIPSRLDSSNLQTDYLRNKIRLSLLPRIKEEFNPRIVESLNRTADIISSQQEYISKKCELILRGIVTKRKSKLMVDTAEFLGYHACLQREMIRLCVKELKGDLNRFTFESVERALNLIHKEKRGKRAKLVESIWLEHGGNELVFYRGGKKEYDYPLTLPGKAVLSEWGIRICGKILKRKPAQEELVGPHHNLVYLDWKKLKSPFRLRTRRRGDRFKPLGMKGSKSVADFLIDAQVPRHQRDLVAILTSKGKIAWVVGYRESEGFKVTGDTRSVLKIEVTYLDT